MKEENNREIYSAQVSNLDFSVTHKLSTHNPIYISHVF